VSRFAKKEDIKVGVCGYGGAFHMGRQHLHEMRVAGMTPTAVCDPDAARLDAAREDYPGIETYATLDELLAKSKTDLVTIITPHNTHAELALQCIEAGRHVVCEKPMALCTEECDAMIAAAAKHDVMLSVYHNRHWDGGVLKALEVIASGQIGQVVRIEAAAGGYAKPGDWWRSSKSISGGILLDWGVHMLEYSFQILTAPIAEVTGFLHRGFWGPGTSWKDDAIEDEGVAVVRFEDGRHLSLTISSIDSTLHPYMIRVAGTHGGFAFNPGDWELTTHEDGERVVRTGRHAGQGIRYYENVAAHLAQGEPLVITAEWARRPIHVLDLAMRSAVEGCALPAVHR
jgi:scyllo-inositol 2-dehydrogenase (NADP+)